VVRVELQYFVAGPRVGETRPLAHRCLSGFDVVLPRSVEVPLFYLLCSLKNREVAGILSLGLL
jgi:hypothetical protein